ncbi:MAG: O-antigen ligase family protein [Terracidiphilus sp.]
MQTATLKYESAPTEVDLSLPAVSHRSDWILILPFIFLAAHGVFSYQTAEAYVGGTIPGESERNRGVFIDIVVPGIAYGIMLWHMKSSWRSIVSYATHFKVFTCLALLTICSAAWSQDPGRSFFFGCSYLVCTLFGYYLVSRFEPGEIMTLVSRTGVIVCLLGLFAVAFFPQYGIANTDVRDPNSWRGIFIDRTSAAKVTVFLLGPTLVAWGSRSKSRQVLTTLLFLVMIIKAQAVTAIFVLLIFLGFLVFLRLGRKLGPKLSLAYLVSVATGAGLVALFSYAYLPDILRSFGRDPTMTGRTVIWPMLVGSILKRPLLGYGFYAFWQHLNGESGNVIKATNWSFGYAHNGLLEIGLQLGLLGLALFFVTLIQAVRNAWFCFRYDQSGDNDWYIALIVLTIAYNMDEGTVLFPNDLLSILYIVACVGLALAARQLKANRHLNGGLRI